MAEADTTSINIESDRHQIAIDHTEIASRFWQLKSLAEMAATAANDGCGEEHRVVLVNALEGISELANRYAQDHFNAS